MSDEIPLEKAIREQIAFLQAELFRIRTERLAGQQQIIGIDEDWMRAANNDPNFHEWREQKLLRELMEANQ